MKLTLRLIVVVCAALAGVGLAQAQGSPVTTQSLNYWYFPGSPVPSNYTSVQQALTAACAANGATGEIIIQQGAAPTGVPTIGGEPSYTIAGCTSAGGGVTIRDERGVNGASCYVYSNSTTYVQGPCSTSASSGFNLPAALVASPYNYVNTFAQLESAVTSCGSSACNIVIATTIAVPSNYTIPSNVTLYFLGTQLQPASMVTLTVAATIVSSPTQIFGGAGSIAGMSVARPEWFGTTHIGTAVIGALVSTGSTVLLAPATYISDFPGTTQSACMAKPGVKFVGAQRPGYNSGYTALQNGTIIQGTFCLGANYVEVRNLGVDAGSALGTPQNGLVIDNAGSQAPGITPLQSPIVDNVNCLLTSATAAFHCMLLENVANAYVNNIQLVYGVHGLAFKGIESFVNNVWSVGHGSDGVIVASNTYALTYNDSFTNVTCDQVASGDTAVCFVVDVEGGSTGGGAISHINLTGMTADNMNTGGINLTGQTVPNNVSDVNISNVNVDGTSGASTYGVGLYGAMNNITLTNGVTNNLGYGIFVGTPVTDLSISNWNGTNFATNGMLLRGYTQIANTSIRNSVGACYTIVAEIVVGTNYLCPGSSTPATTVTGGTFLGGVLPTLQVGPTGPEYITGTYNALGFNYSPVIGAISSTSGFGYTLVHAASTTSTLDTLCWSAYNPNSTLSLLNADCMNGNGQRTFKLAPITPGYSLTSTSGLMTIQAPASTALGTLTETVPVPAAGSTDTFCMASGAGGGDCNAGTAPVGHNPTATATGAAINGTASTFMRSDAAPAIQTASSTTLGLAKCDGVTITCTSGQMVAVSAAPSGSAGGDLSGTYPNPTVAKVDGVAYSASPTTNTVPVVTGTNTVTYEAVPNAALANSTISGVSLGSNLNTLTFGTHLTSGGSSFNGSAAVTITSDATSANTNSTIMARDSSGNFAASTATITTVNATTGYEYNGTAPSGHCLLGNGTNYVDSASCITSSGFPITIGSTSVGAGSTNTSLAGITGLGLTSGGELSWNSDVGFSRAGSASLKLGNGTVSDTSGGLFLQDLIVTTGAISIDYPGQQDTFPFCMGNGGTVCTATIAHTGNAVFNAINSTPIGSTTPAAGTFSIVTSPLITSYSGTATVPAATATTVLTLPNVAASHSYLVACSTYGAAASVYSAISSVTTQATSSIATAIQTGSLVAISMSGLNVQVTYTSGGSAFTCNATGIQ